MEQTEGKRFRRALFGYKRSAVDLEMDKLLIQVDQMAAEGSNMQQQIDTLTGEKIAMTSERERLTAAVETANARATQLEQCLQVEKATADNLRSSVEASDRKRSALEETCDQLRRRDREYALREREFAELQGSVSSIMSVTKRATDRLFQRAVDNQEKVSDIAGAAAKEVADIRIEMSKVRMELNSAMDAIQDRLDRIDATFTNTVQRLVAIKHDNGIQPGADSTNVYAEVERLLSMNAGEVDYAGGKGYSVPVLGPYSSKFLSDTARTVNEGQQPVTVRRVRPSEFESTDESITEARILLENGSARPGFAVPEEPAPAPAAPVQTEAPLGFSHEDSGYGEFEVFTGGTQPEEIFFDSGDSDDGTMNAVGTTVVCSAAPAFVDAAPVYCGDPVTGIQPAMQMGKASFVEYSEPEQSKQQVSVTCRTREPKKVRVYYKRPKK